MGNKNLVQEVIRFESQLQKQIMDKFLKKQKAILEKTTQLLSGLERIFAVPQSSKPRIISNNNCLPKVIIVKSPQPVENVTPASDTELSHIDTETS